MSYTIDANVLLYASDESSPVHARARAFVERLADGPEIAYLFWPIVMGLQAIRLDRPVMATGAGAA